MPRPTDQSLWTLDTSDAARRAITRSGTLEVALAPRLAEALADPVGAISYEYRGRIDAQGRAAATLHLRAQLALRCDRCGEPASVGIDETGHFFFVDDEAVFARLPVEDVEEEPLLGSPRFDLRALIEDQVLLALPMSPRHETCLPREPEVEGETTEPQPERPHPFAALAALKRRQ
jgi:uncharacterized protein